ncbi:MAG TPA: PHP domain-containing protein [Burkholderiaceae bacterium]|nr:PHP domain-containing protein [Burkholderiaceae bacterium]
MWIDCHCHTKYSNDNWLEPVDLVRRAKQLGLDGLVVTEHHSVEVSEPVERIGKEEGLLVLRGVEVSTDRGHMLAYGLQDDGWNVWGRDNYLPWQEVIERANSMGAICVPAHPYREIGLGSLLEGLLDLEGIAAIETHNGGNPDHINELAVVSSQIMRLPGLGGSDCHKQSAVGRCATEFSRPIRDLADFIAAVRAGACRGAYYPAYRLPD